MNSAARTQYEGQPQQHPDSPTLPYTGTDVSFVAALAAVLVLLGVCLRGLTR